MTTKNNGRRGSKSDDVAEIQSHTHGPLQINTHPSQTHRFLCSSDIPAVCCTLVSSMNSTRTSNMTSHFCWLCAAPPAPVPVEPGVRPNWDDAHDMGVGPPAARDVDAALLAGRDAA